VALGRNKKPASQYRVVTPVTHIQSVVVRRTVNASYLAACVRALEDTVDVEGRTSLVKNVESTHDEHTTISWLYNVHGRWIRNVHLLERVQEHWTTLGVNGLSPKFMTVTIWNISEHK
jgi:hypothetical protein